MAQGKGNPEINKKVATSALVTLLVSVVGFYLGNRYWEAVASLGGQFFEHWGDGFALMWPLIADTPTHLDMLSINDQHVTAELKFTPNSQNGTIDIDLGKFDASSLDGHDLVVFEELYKQTEQGNEATEVLVAEHKDIDDEGQTVTVTTTPPGGFFGKTGGNDFFIVVSIAALAVLACGCAYYGIKNRRAAKAEDAAVDEGGDTDNGDVSGDSEA